MTPSEGSRGTTLSRARERPDSCHDGHSYGLDMNTTTSPQIQPRPFNPAWRAALFGVLATISGFLCFIWYALSAQPILETCSGGAADSVTGAAMLGIGLVAAGTYLTVRTGRPGRLLVAFFLAYVAVLFALWEASPLLFGPRTCSSNGLF
jgi:hypothetical protein